MEWNQQIIEMIKSRKYPNLYTDISSSFADSGFRDDFRKFMIDRKNEETVNILKHHILFGTDWYMTFVYSAPFVGKNLWDYCTETKKFLDEFDTSLWPAFTQYNPYRFYRLDEQIGRIAENIIRMRTDDKWVIEELGKGIDEDEITKIKKEAAWIKAANQGHTIIKETRCIA